MTTEISQPLKTELLWNEVSSYLDFRRQRNRFGMLLGKKAQWWLVNAKVVKGKKSVVISPVTHRIWPETELPKGVERRYILHQISKRHKNATWFEFPHKANPALTVHCMPLLSGRIQHYYLVISNLEKKPRQRSTLHLLHTNIRMIISHVTQELKLKRATECIRPRMVALSTVHTIHRLINTTVSLQELYQKLARLTAQVLRATECSIWIKDKNKTTKRLVEKGNSKLKKAPVRGGRSTKIGEGLEGRVFTTSTHVLKRNILSVPLIDDDIVGVITLKGKKGREGFNNFDKEILMTLSEEAVVAIKNAELYEDQKRMTFETIESLTKALSARFSQHSRFKSKTLLMITSRVADELRLSDDVKQEICHATLLKDASKIALPDKILKKSSRLTGKEYQMIKNHPVEGARIVKSFKNLKPVAPILLHSQEKFDGTGYPDGLKGDQIPIGARILSVVNTFDALVAGRPYKRGKSISEAIKELRRNCGTQFDPDVVNIFEKIISKKRIAGILHKEISSHASR